MSFITDKQTLDDLNLLGKYKANSVFSLFNKVNTAGGEQLLEVMFRNPLTDAVQINKRSQIFNWFGSKGWRFPFDQATFVRAENYLGSGGSTSRMIASINTWKKKMLHTIGLDKEFEAIVAGLQATMGVLNDLKRFLPNLEGDHPFAHEVRTVKDILNNHLLHWVGNNHDSLSLATIIRYDNLLRLRLRNDMTAILQFIYQLDVYITVSAIAREKGYSYARALPRELYTVQIEECRHPSIEKAVANTVSIQRNSNVLFVTGANMAGKSTFMKSFAIAIYLAHMGFPVAASAMEFSVRDGIYTSINVPDNLQMGYSHFYAEVKRVKMVAKEVSAGKNLVVIFDELFKGTNVKDAYDATLSVTKAFAAYQKCIFVISTHIIEVADALKAACSNLQFVFFPTIMEGTVPRYTYRMQAGVTADRHGMMIIQNEDIVGIIRAQLASR
jgi:Mismatch repair ATPase (MutS family)